MVAVIVAVVVVVVKAVLVLAVVVLVVVVLVVVVAFLLLVIILVVVVAVHTVFEIDPSDPLNISPLFTWALDQALTHAAPQSFWLKDVA